MEKQSQPPASRPICGVHGLALDPDGKCVICRREGGNASQLPESEDRPEWGKFVLGGAVGLIVAGVMGVLVLRAVGEATASGSGGEAPTAAEIDSMMASLEVELYTTSWCGYCKKARQYFDEKGIAYVEYDVEKDRRAAEERQRLTSGNGVPVVSIDGEVVAGFSPQGYSVAIAEAVKKRREERGAD